MEENRVIPKCSPISRFFVGSNIISLPTCQDNKRSFCTPGDNLGGRLPEVPVHGMPHPFLKGTAALARNQPKATRITVAPVAVRAQSWAEMSSPAITEVTLTRSAHQTIPPAERAKFRAVAAGTISMAVTNKTPTAQTEKMTTKDKSPAWIY